MVAMAKSLAKTVFSIGTTTLKVTEDKMEESEEEEDSKSKQIKSNQEWVTIDGIRMLNSNDNKAMLLKTGETDKDMAGNKPDKKNQANPRNKCSKNLKTK